MNILKIDQQFMYFRIRVIKALRIANDISKEFLLIQDEDSDHTFASFVKLGGITLILNQLSSNELTHSLQRLIISLFLMIVLKINFVFSQVETIGRSFYDLSHRPEYQALTQIVKPPKFNVTYILLGILLKSHDCTLHNMIYTILSYLVKLSPEVVSQVLEKPQHHNLSPIDEEISPTSSSIDVESKFFGDKKNESKISSENEMFILNGHRSRPTSAGQLAKILPDINMLQLPEHQIIIKPLFEHHKLPDEASSLSYLLSICKLHPNRLTILTRCAEILELLIVNSPQNTCLCIAKTPTIDMDEITKYFSVDEKSSSGYVSGTSSVESQNSKNLNSYLHQKSSMISKVIAKNILLQHQMQSDPFNSNRNIHAYSFISGNDKKLEPPPLFPDNSQQWGGIIFMFQTVRRLCNNISELQNQILNTSSSSSASASASSNRVINSKSTVKEIYNESARSDNDSEDISIPPANTSTFQFDYNGLNVLICATDQLVKTLSLLILKSKRLAEMASLTNIPMDHMLSTYSFTNGSNNDPIKYNTNTKKSKHKSKIITISITTIFQKVLSSCPLKPETAEKLRSALLTIKQCIDERQDIEKIQITKRLSTPIPSYARPKTTAESKNNDLQNENEIRSNKKGNTSIRSPSLPPSQYSSFHIGLPDDDEGGFFGELEFTGPILNTNSRDSKEYFEYPYELETVTVNDMTTTSGATSGVTAPASGATGAPIHTTTTTSTSTTAVPTAAAAVGQLRKRTSLNSALTSSESSLAALDELLAVAESHKQKQAQKEKENSNEARDSNDSKYEYEPVAPTLGSTDRRNNNHTNNTNSSNINNTHNALLSSSQQLQHQHHQLKPLNAVTTHPHPSVINRGSVQGSGTGNGTGTGTPLVPLPMPVPVPILSSSSHSNHHQPHHQQQHQQQHRGKKTVDEWVSAHEDLRMMGSIESKEYKEILEKLKHSLRHVYRSSSAATTGSTAIATAIAGGAGSSGKVKSRNDLTSTATINNSDNNNDNSNSSGSGSVNSSDGRPATATAAFAAPATDNARSSNKHTDNATDNNNNNHNHNNNTDNNNNNNKAVAAVSSKQGGLSSSSKSSAVRNHSANSNNNNSNNNDIQQREFIVPTSLDPLSEAYKRPLTSMTALSSSLDQDIGLHSLHHRFSSHSLSQSINSLSGASSSTVTVKSEKFFDNIVKKKKNIKQGEKVVISETEKRNLVHVERLRRVFEHTPQYMKTVLDKKLHTYHVVHGSSA